MEIPYPGRPVRQPPDAHGPEHCLQGTLVPGLDPHAPHPLIADHLIQALLARCPQREVIIQKPPQKLPAVTVKTLLELGVREPGSVRAVQETDQRLKLRVARAEPGRSNRLAR